MNLGKCIVLFKKYNNSVIYWKTLVLYYSSNQEARVLRKEIEITPVDARFVRPLLRWEADGRRALFEGLARKRSEVVGLSQRSLVWREAPGTAALRSPARALSARPPVPLPLQPQTRGLQYRVQKPALQTSPNADRSPHQATFSALLCIKFEH